MHVYAEGALHLSIDAGVARLKLNRPASRNAIDVAMWTALPEAVAQAARDPAVHALVVGGAGGNFASGANMSEFDATFADHAAALDYGARLDRATRALAEFDRPVVACIEGYCIGAGLAIALACDLRLAADDARLGAPPAKLGLVYSLADTRRLIEATSVSVAKDMLFTGALTPAPEALRTGLVDEVHAPDALHVAVAVKCAAIGAVSSASVRRAKTIVAMATSGVTRDTDETRGWFAEATQGEDFAEGLAAFRARRPPNFTR